MDNALIIGAGYIGTALLNYLREMQIPTMAVSRVGRSADNIRPLDIRYDSVEFPNTDVIYICSGITRFVDCEQGRDGYQVNVDAPIRIAKSNPKSLVVYLSSEAVEIALHTAYGMQKALAESSLQTLPNTSILRLGRVGDVDLEIVCRELYEIGRNRSRGLHQWQSVGMCAR